MNTKWIAVVNRIDARIYSEKGFAKVVEMTNEIGRATDGELSTHTMSPTNSPHERAAVDFSKKIGKYLESQFALGSFNHLLLVAEPKMFGLVKASMSQKLIDQSDSLQKDYEKMNLEDLKSAILKAFTAGHVSSMKDRETNIHPLQF